MKKTLLLALITGLVFTACKKDDDTPDLGDTQQNPGPQHTTQQVNLTNGNTKIWKFTGIHIKGETPQGQQIDQNGEPDPCALDNRYTFDISGDYSSTTGTEKCDPSEEDMIEGSWKFIDDKTFEWNGTTMELVSLTKDELIVRYDDQIDFGVFILDATITSTYNPE